MLPLARSSTSRAISANKSCNKLRVCAGETTAYDTKKDQHFNYQLKPNQGVRNCKSNCMNRKPDSDSLMHVLLCEDQEAVNMNKLKKKQIFGQKKIYIYIYMGQKG